MVKSKFDKDEADLIESYEAGEWHSHPSFEQEREKYFLYAQAAFKKDKRINIRISTNDLLGIQEKALQEGIPYQTLIASVLHKYIAGRFTEKSEKAG